MGQYLEDEEKGEDLGLGTIEKDFRSRGKRPEENERSEEMEFRTLCLIKTLDTSIYN